MRALPALLLLLALTFSAAAQPSIVDQFEKRSQTHDGVTIPYRLFVPADYDSTQRYPLVLALHGAGERGSDNERQIQGHRLATSWADPVNQAENPAFVVAPQVPSGERWTADQPIAQSAFNGVQLTTLAILDSLEQEFSIDTNRVYITGLSMGGHGTWDFIARRPNRFAAAVPMSGRTWAEQAEASLHLPIWAFHGESDTVVPAAGTRGIIQRMEDLGRTVLYTDCRRAPTASSKNFDCPTSISQDSLEKQIDAHADLIFTGLRNGGHGPWSVWYDHPLLADWLFSKYRVDPDAITLTAPTAGANVSGMTDVTWTPTATGDTVEVWLSLDNGASWAYLDEVPGSGGSYTLDPTPHRDTPFARLRLFQRNEQGFVYSRTTSDAFTLDNPGDAPPYLSLDDQVFRFTTNFAFEHLELTLHAADPEGAMLTLDIAYSIDSGRTFLQIDSEMQASTQAAQTLTVPIAALANSDAAQVRLTASDGTLMTTVLTPIFQKITPREATDNIAHVAGAGDGTVTMHVVDESLLTSHRYRITFDDTDPAAKTYDVTDVDLGATVLTGVPLSDGVRESPAFDGMRLVVVDLPTSMADPEATGWTGAKVLDVVVNGISTMLNGQAVPLLATEHTYAVAITESFADTSEALFGLTAQPMRFTVTSRTDGQPRAVLYEDVAGDGLPAPRDRLHILEDAGDGTLAPAWELQFFSAGSQVDPAPGDTFVLVPLRKFSAEDVFEFFGGVGGVHTEAVPQAEALAWATYPNPFRDRLQVSYRLAHPATVRLELYDVLGRRVAVLEDQPRPPGDHSFAWHRGGTPLANGWYLLRLTATPATHGPPLQLHRALIRVE